MPHRSSNPNGFARSSCVRLAKKGSDRFNTKIVGLRGPRPAPWGFDVAETILSHLHHRVVIYHRPIQGEAYWFLSFECSQTRRSTLTKVFFAFYFRFILFVGSGAFTVYPSSLFSLCSITSIFFSLSLCLDLHVFNVNATKNHDPFLLILLIQFSFTFFRSFISSGLFHVTGFRQIPWSFYGVGGKYPHLNFFFPCTTMTSPDLAGEYGHYPLGWSRVLFLINMIVGRGFPARKIGAGR